MIKMYGIKNCGTVKKAMQYLQDKGLEFQFHDFKKEGINKAMIEKWHAALGWETLLNKKGMTWRKFSEAQKQNLSKTKAIQLMLENSSVIKRPIIEKGKKILIGFNEEEYQSL